MTFWENRIKRDITFFYTDGVEYQTAQPIAEEATRRGFRVRFSKNIFQKAEIGVYCQHRCFPECSKFSMVMLHDLAQGHNRWPNIWIGEPWNKFDIAILPGDSWVERWQECSWDPFVRPRIGVFKLGWPKADLVFVSEDRFRRESASFRKELGLIHHNSVIYAPSWENDGKQDEFVQALKDLPVNLLLKQAPWAPKYQHIIENIRLMNEKHRDCGKNVKIIDSNISIMRCLGLANIIVSEESSVMFEGLLFDIPSIAVTDWLIPDCAPPRPPSVPFDFIRKVSKSGLRNAVIEMLETLESHKQALRDYRNRNFAFLGESSKKIVSLLECCIDGRMPEVFPETPSKVLKPLTLRRKYQAIRRWIREMLFKALRPKE